MAMNRYGYLDYRNLQLGDMVSWEHPVNGKVYDFDVVELDLKDVYQPVRLRLLDEIDYQDIINVSEYAEFGFRGARTWVYKSLEAHRERYGYEPDPNSITLDRLFYTSTHHVPKTEEPEIEDIPNGRILAHRALMEDLTTEKGDGYKLYHGFNKLAKTEVQATQGDLQIPSAEEANQYRYTSQADFQKMFVEQLAEAIKRDEDHIKLPPVLIEMYKDELVNLGYRVNYDMVWFAKFD